MENEKGSYFWFLLHICRLDDIPGYLKSIAKNEDGTDNKWSSGMEFETPPLGKPVAVGKF